MQCAERTQLNRAHSDEYGVPYLLCLRPQLRTWSCRSPYAFVASRAFFGQSSLSVFHQIWTLAQRFSPSWRCCSTPQLAGNSITVTRHINAPTAFQPEYARYSHLYAARAILGPALAFADTPRRFWRWDGDEFAVLYRISSWTKLRPSRSGYAKLWKRPLSEPHCADQPQHRLYSFLAQPKAELISLVTRNGVATAGHRSSLTTGIKPYSQIIPQRKR